MVPSNKKGNPYLKRSASASEDCARSLQHEPQQQRSLQALTHPPPAAASRSSRSFRKTQSTPSYTTRSDSTNTGPRPTAKAKAKPAWGCLKSPTAKDIAGPGGKRRKALDAPPQEFGYMLVMDFEWTVSKTAKIPHEIIEFPAVLYRQVSGELSPLYLLRCTTPYICLYIHMCVCMHSCLFI
jgi:hypothetical protein